MSFNGLTQIEGPKSVEECCPGAGTGWFGATLCEAVCVMCCAKFSVGKPDLAHDGRYNNQKPKTSTADDDDSDTTDSLSRDYGSSSVLNGSIQFSVSQYAKFIPIVFGADRLGGNVFWSSGFKEGSFTTDKVYTYKYCNFAIGFCEGEVQAVLRVWIGDDLIINNTVEVDANGVAQPNADGFIGGAQVDLTSADSPLRSLSDAERITKVTIFNGSETQLPEGVMADEEGYELTPAYRGLSYILFENFIADKTVPPITVEVLSNTVGLYPRLYWDLPSPKQKFDAVIDANWLLYDPNYDYFVVRGRDTADNSKRGFILIDGNTLEEIRQLEIVTRHNINQTEFNNSRGVLTPQGHIVMASQDGNQGIVRIINAETGTIDCTFGPGGTLTAHNSSGFGAPKFVTIVPGVSPYYNTPAPVLVVTGSVNKSIGFATIDTNNQVKFRSTINNQITYINHIICSAVIGDAFEQSVPEFADGGSTAGTHVFIFSWSSTDKDKIAVQRVTLNDNTTAASLLSPTLTEMTDGIPYDQLNGSGYTHTVKWATLDPSDNCFILYIDSQRSPDLIVKWSPFTGDVVWKKGLSTRWTIVPHVHNADIVDGKLGVYATNNKLWQLDTTTGDMELVLDDFTAQQLNTALSAMTYYNGAENSLTWLTTTTGKRLTKVFLKRLSRSNVAVSSIVTNLLQRVGISSDLLVVDDLQALTLDGYTINNRKSLRTIFSELAQVFKFDIIETDGRINYRSRGSASVEEIPTSDLRQTDENGWLQATKVEDFVGTRKINLTYRDIERDYDNNVQNVNLPKYEETQFDSDAAIDVTVPIVLDAQKAKSLAEILLYAKLTYLEQYEFTAAPKHLRLDPSDVITITEDGSDDAVMRIRTVELGNDRNVKITASREDPDIYNDTVNLFGATGRYQTDQLNPPTPRVDPIVLHIPGRTDGEISATSQTYLIFLALLNRRSLTPPSGGLVIDIDNGVEKRVVAAPKTFPTWGVVETPLNPTTAWSSTDFASELIIQLVNPGPITLASAPSLAAMIDDASINLAYVGRELIQFQTVTDLGDGRYKLTNINRAKFGTEPTVNNHISGEPFVLLSDATGQFDTTSIVVSQINRGDTTTKVVQLTVTGSNNPYQSKPISQWIGLNLRPRAVTDWNAVYGSTDLTMSWQRRSRYGNELPDDGPEGWVETEPEEYTMYLYTDPTTFDYSDQTTYLRKLTLTTNTYVYDDATQTADGFDRTTDTLYVSLAHSGSVIGEQYGVTRQFAIPPKT